METSIRAVILCVVRRCVVGNCTPGRKGCVVQTDTIKWLRERLQNLVIHPDGEI